MAIIIPTFISMLIYVALIMLVIKLDKLEEIVPDVKNFDIRDWYGR